MERKKRAKKAMQCCSVVLRLTFKYALQHKPLIEFLSDCNNKINSSLEFLLLGKERAQADKKYTFIRKNENLKLSQQ